MRETMTSVPISRKGKASLFKSVKELQREKMVRQEELMHFSVMPC